MDHLDAKRESIDKDSIKMRTTKQQPKDDVSLSTVHFESIHSQSRQASIADILRTNASPMLLTKTRTTEQQPQDDVSLSTVQIESIHSQSQQASTADSPMLTKTRKTEQQPQDDMSLSTVQIESIHSPSRQASTADILRTEALPMLRTFNSKKSVSLLGGFPPDILYSKSNTRPRVVVIPTSIVN
jgi:hypothetical protein